MGLNGRIVTDDCGIITKVNKHALKFLGYNKADDIKGMNVSIILPSPFREEWSSYVAQYFKHSTSDNQDWHSIRIIEALHSSKIVIPLRIKLSKYEIKHIVEYVVQFEPYKLSKARISINKDGSITHVNEHVQRLLGWEDKELIDKNITMIMSEPHRSMHNNYLSRYYKTGKKKFIGRLQWIQVRHKNGDIIPLVLMVLENENNCFTGTFYEENDTECLIVFECEEENTTKSKECSILSASYSALYLFGYKPSELRGCKLDKILPRFSNDVQRLSGTYRCQAITKNNTMFHVDVCVSEIKATNRDYKVVGRDVLVTPLATDETKSPIIDVKRYKSAEVNTNNNRLTRRYSCSILLSEEGFIKKAPFPQVIHEWEIINGMANGGFSRVYRGVNVKSKIESAIKCFNKKELLDSNILSMVTTEIDITKRIHLSMEQYRKKYDANYDINGIDERSKIPNVLDVFETSENIFMCQEFIEGSTLSLQCMATDRGKFSERETQHYFREIVSIVAFLHSRKIAHRDLKLTNIMLEEETNIIKLIDFGLSTIIVNDKLSNEYFGSIPYLPPEIYREIPYQPIYADIWSLGVCLIIMLTGDDLVDMVEEVTNNHLFDYLQYAGIESEDLKDLICKLLNVNPLERPTINEILNHTWLNKIILQSASTPNSPPSSPSYYG